MSDVAFSYQSDKSDYITYKAKSGELLSLPAAIIDSWSPKQIAWVNSKVPADGRYSPLVDRYVKLALEVYRRQAAPKWVECVPVTVRQLNKFQFWFRIKLEAWGFI